MAVLTPVITPKWDMGSFLRIIAPALNFSPIFAV